MELNYCYGCMEPLPRKVTRCPHCGYDNSKRRNPDDILPEGSILNGKYLVGKMLGRGGFGVTYLGLELNLLVKVAIKEYFPIGVGIRSPYTGKVQPVSSLSDPEDFRNGLNEFLKEARTLALFNSPYFVHVREFFNENGTAYIVMDYVEGIGLDQEISKYGGMHWQRVLSLMKPLMLELDKMHRLELIHRDIKPGNIRLTKDPGSGGERLILLDFGSARHFISENVTKTYTAMVTAGFSPFEQYSEKSRQGPYTDVYAVCATIYSAITGTVPPAAPDRISGEAELQPFSSFGLDVPEKVEKAITHGLAIRRAERPGSMRDLCNELEDGVPEQDPEELLYLDAKRLMISDSADDYQKALELFGKIPGWKDSDELSAECRRRIAKLESEAVIAETVITEPETPVVQEQKSSPSPKNLRITVLIALVLAAAGFFVFYGMHVKERNQAATQTAVSLIQTADAEEIVYAEKTSIAGTKTQEAIIAEQTSAVETRTQEVIFAEETSAAGTRTQEAIFTEETNAAETKTQEAIFIEQTRSAETKTQAAEYVVRTGIALMKTQEPIFAEQTVIAGTKTQEAINAERTRIAGTKTQEAINSERTRIAGTKTQEAVNAEQTRIAGTKTQEAVNAEQTRIAGTNTQEAIDAEQTRIAGTRTQEAIDAEQTRIAGTKTQEAVNAEQTRIAGTRTQEAIIAEQTRIAGTKTQEAIDAEQTRIVGTKTQEAIIAEQTRIAGTKTQEAVNAEQTRIAGTRTQEAIDAEQTRIAGTKTQEAIDAEQTRIAGTKTQEAINAEQTRIAGIKTQEAIIAEQTRIAGTKTQEAINAEQTRIAGTKTQEAINAEQTSIAQIKTLEAIAAVQTMIAETQNAIHVHETEAAFQKTQDAIYLALTRVMQTQQSLDATNTKAAEPTATPTPTNTPRPTATNTPVPTRTPTATPTKRPTATATKRPTSTPTKRPTSTPAPSKSKPSVGSFLYFGSYEQDNNRSNGKESIRWKVLDVQGNKALLLSTQVLDAQQFHNKAEIGGGWAASNLRSWMMNDFYNSAFSAREKNAILRTAQRATSKDTSDDYDTVFVLSTEQVKKYLTRTADRQFTASAYAIKERKVFRGADGYYNWWTRSNHVESGSFWKDQIDIVRKYGEIAYTKPTDADCGILPAVWIDISAYMNL